MPTYVSFQDDQGRKHRYQTEPIGTNFKAEAGNYIFTKVTSSNTWAPVYIGETDNLWRRLNDEIESHHKIDCIRAEGAAHIHTHPTPGGEAVRKDEEAALVRHWNPPCNG